ncbi:hypothetical protein DFS34DRAFT_592601 [Phlyctochytrium arcticum]|nr:hypothetical protein DFS34DRAFT_592601 [Phlyctochytrium arcticum]
MPTTMIFSLPLAIARSKDKSYWTMGRVPKASKGAQRPQSQCEIVRAKLAIDGPVSAGVEPPRTNLCPENPGPQVSASVEPPRTNLCPENPGPQVGDAQQPAQALNPLAPSSVPKHPAPQSVMHSSQRRLSTPWRQISSPQTGAGQSREAAAEPLSGWNPLAIEFVPEAHIYSTRPSTARAHGQ